MSRFKLENFVLASKAQHTYLENGMVQETDLSEGIPLFFAIYLTDIKPPGEITLTNKTSKTTFSAYGSYSRLKPDKGNHDEEAAAVEDQPVVMLLRKAKRIFYLMLVGEKDCSVSIGVKFRK